MVTLKVEGITGLCDVHIRRGPLRRVHAKEASSDSQCIDLVRQKHLQPSGTSFNVFIDNLFSPLILC